MSPKRFFKKAKKNTSSIEGKNQFPSNPRIINESSRFSFPEINSVKLFKIYGGVLKFFVFFIFIVAVIVVALDLKNNLQVKQEIDSQREVLNRDLNFWEDFISKHQNYPDAYFQASILEYKLGNISKSKIYAERGLALDPNSEDGKKLEKFLVNK